MQHRPDILHLTSAHPLSDTRIFVKEAQSLAAAGFRVVLAGPGASASGPVEVIGLPRPKGRFARFSSLGYRLFRLAQTSGARAVHIHDPDLLPWGMRLQAKGQKVVYDVHEDYPQALRDRAWLGQAARLAARGVQTLETYAARRLSGFVLADALLQSRFPPERSVTIRNFIEAREWQDLAPRYPGTDRPLQAVYVGDLTAARGLWSMCDGLAAARAGGVAVDLLLLGPMSEPDRATLARHPAAPWIKAPGRAHRGDVVRALQQADLGLCLLTDTPAYRRALPVKVLEYLMAGLPVLVHTGLTRLLGDEPALAPGLHACNAHAAEDVAQALARLSHQRTEARHAAAPAREAVIRDYSWEGEAARLVAFYQSLLAAP